MKKLLLLTIAIITSVQIFAQADRVEVELEKARHSTVIFTFGQSNSANHGQVRYTAQHEVYNYFEGKLYKAQDPLLGASGKGSSVWGILGDKLIEKGLATSVTIVPIGIGSVKVEHWAKGGKFYKHLESTVDRLIADNINIDIICWHQGESDNIANTPKEEYIHKFETIREVFRSRGIKAPIIVAIASYHPRCLEENNGCSDEIRDAQKELAKRYDDIYRGPDTDKLNKCCHRADGIHMSGIGQPLHADMWLKSIRKFLK